MLIRAQEVHIKAIHILIELVERALFSENYNVVSEFRSALLNGSI